MSTTSNVNIRNIKRVLGVCPKIGENYGIEQLYKHRKQCLHSDRNFILL